MRASVLVALMSLAVAAPAAAEVKVDGRVLPEPQKAIDQLQSTPAEKLPNYRQLMRDIVVELADYARKRNPNFIVMMRNGQELMHKQEREQALEEIQDPAGVEAERYPPLGSPVRSFLRHVDGWVVDGLFCGREKVDEPTAHADRDELKPAVEWMQKNGRPILSIDYCLKDKLPAEARTAADKAKVLSLIARDNRLDQIPPGRPRFEHPKPVTTAGQVRNFLPMLHSDAYATLGDWAMALKNTNYDLLIVDPFHRGKDPLTKKDVETLRYKSIGARRLVLADMRLGVASDSAWYWKKDWEAGKPPFLIAADPRQAGDFYVQYWEKDWKTILGNYMKGIVDLGFDGVVLDDVNLYLYFESLTPLD